MQVHGNSVRFGIHSGQQVSTFDESLRIWTTAEELGYDWVSVFDHYRPPLGGPKGPCLDGPTLLGALAARTSRVRCALLVSPVTWRNPAVTATIAATIDQISHGRLELGVGAGGSDMAYAEYGIAFPPAPTRLEMLDESCQIIRRLWSDESTTFVGRHYQLTDAHLEPKPIQRHLPLVVGGEGERRSLRIVARYADIWNALPGTPDHYRHKLDVLARHCDEVGRDPADVRKSITFRVVLDDTGPRAVRRAESQLDRLGADPELRSEYLCFGTPEECFATLRPYLRLGVRDFLLGARPPVDWRTVEMFAERVVPLLRAEATN
ncbi:TIGR03560 family F420-dependent LLM class oxidoreductase [Micromonospora sp. CPCC 206060]|uniref:TIGR03560 family F420-dependent LLM class oxidoreductase n=1 Tax=Micromonospora sp. CPCC 206060 TaxID=3122406 RepID=UPI002FF3BBC3